ncbi:hypothetical protein [Pseudoxanthomonas sp.]|uniref:hypothetical protein n=1 Tax=Pseudoxanthomonas sp. TaxID=1871049 RepID=UPI003F823851
MKHLLLIGLLTTNPGIDDVLALGGISLGESEHSVVRRLGPPMKREEREGDYLPVTLSYRGLVVRLDEQGVGGLSSVDARFCTSNGACPGMSYAKVQDIYGTALTTETVEGGQIGYVYGDGCWLKFSQRAGRVSVIELACLP